MISQNETWGRFDGFGVTQDLSLRMASKLNAVRSGMPEPHPFAEPHFIGGSGGLNVASSFDEPCLEYTKLRENSNATVLLSACSGNRDVGTNRVRSTSHPVQGAQDGQGRYRRRLGIPHGAHSRHWPN